MQKLKKLTHKLIDKCNIHPTPNTYALFAVLKNRKILPTINELLDKYWFPTWRIISFSENIV
jgi:hypothetical protein